MIAKNAFQQSQALSGLQGSPSAKLVQNPWSGRLQGSVSPTSSSNVSCKGKEKLHDSRMQELSVDFDVDGELSGSEESLDEEFGMSTIITLGAKKAQLARKALGSDGRPIDLEDTKLQCRD